MADTINVTVNQAISPIKTWTPSTSYSIGDVVYNSPFLYRVDSSFTSGATFATTNMTTISPRNKVYVQTGIPTVQVIASPVEGDHCVVTSDGTTSGTTQSSWVYNGTNWVLMYTQNTSLAVPTTVRLYYPTTTALQKKWTTVRTAADVTNYGFSGVGGATVTAYAPVFNGYYMLNANATAATTTNNFTIPTSYIRHEIAITAGEDNTYFLATLKDRETVLQVWVCDPTTGVPIKRIASKAVSAISAGRSNTSQPDPENSEGGYDSYHEWIGFEIPKSLVATYKTVSNTIKLAIRPGINNGEVALFYISGFAMATNPYGLQAMACMQSENWLNESTFTAAYQISWSAVYENRATGYITAKTSKFFRVPLTDTSKDLMFNIIILARSGDGNGLGTQTKVTIKHVSGDVVLGSPNPMLECPAVKSYVGYGHKGAGWVIPAATLAAKSVTPTNSGIQYLEIEMYADSSNDQYISGFHAEYAN